MIRRKSRESLVFALGMVLIIAVFALISFLMGGCSQAQKVDIHFGHIGGDAWFRSIADGAQMETSGSTSVDVNTPGMPEQGIPAIGFGVLGKGQGRIANVMIDSVSGNLFIDSALYGAQGVPIPEALEKLFIPGDPFAITEK